MPPASGRSATSPRFRPGIRQAGAEAAQAPPDGRQRLGAPADGHPDRARPDVDRHGHLAEVIRLQPQDRPAPALPQRAHGRQVPQHLVGDGSRCSARAAHLRGRPVDGGRGGAGRRRCRGSGDCGAGRRVGDSRRVRDRSGARRHVRRRTGTSRRRCLRPLVTRGPRRRGVRRNARSSGPRGALGGKARPFARPGRSCQAVPGSRRAPCGAPPRPGGVVSVWRMPPRTAAPAGRPARPPRWGRSTTRPMTPGRSSSPPSRGPTASPVPPPRWRRSRGRPARSGLPGLPGRPGRPGRPGGSARPRPMSWSRPPAAWPRRARSAAASPHPAWDRQAARRRTDPRSRRIPGTSQVTPGPASPAVSRRAACPAEPASSSRPAPRAREPRRAGRARRGRRPAVWPAR